MGFWSMMVKRKRAHIFADFLNPPIIREPILMIMSKNALIASIMIVSACTACSGPRNKATTDPALFTMPDAPKKIVANHSYRLNALDQFNVNVFGAEDLSGSYSVEPSGVANFPLLGTIDVAGMTSTELAAMLEARYARRYLRNPNISVQLTQTTAETVTIEGSVERASTFNLIGTTNLVTAIAQGGGPDRFANLSRVVVLRQIDGVQNAAAFDYARIREGLDENPTIYGGDVVIVGGSRLRESFQEIFSAIQLIAIFRPFG